VNRVGARVEDPVPNPAKVNCPKSATTGVSKRVPGCPVSVNVPPPVKATLEDATGVQGAPKQTVVENWTGAAYAALLANPIMTARAAIVSEAFKNFFML